MPRASTAVKVASIEEYLRGLSQEGDPEKLLQAAMDVIGRLSERLDAQLRARYSPKSEKIDPAQLQLLLAELAREQNPAESPTSPTETAPTPEDEPAARPKRIRENHPGRRPLPADLPREEQRRRPEQTDCGACGKALHTIREEISGAESSRRRFSRAPSSSPASFESRSIRYRRWMISIGIAASIALALKALRK